MDKITTNTKLIGTLKSVLRSLFISSDRPSLPDLPFELVSEILCRLPVKLLVQLRCLSKSFNTLISDPNFAKKHLRLSTTSRNLIFAKKHLRLSTTHDFDNYDKLTLISYPLHSTFQPRSSIFNSVMIKPTELHYPFDPIYNDIVGSCNGILCFAACRYSAKQSHVLLFNPCIRTFKILPSFQIQGKSGFIKYGFGYDHVIDVYKVVAVFSYDCRNEVFKTQGMIHNLGSDSWRMIDGELPLPCVCESLVFVSGALNWIAYKDDNNHSVVSFDLVIESYRRLLQPNYGGEYVHRVNLGVLRDCLSITAYSFEFSSVWQMKEYGNEESWTKLFRVPLYPPYPKPMWIYEDDQVLMDYTLWRWGINLAVYDFKNGTFKKTLTQDFNGAITSEVCVESLISPCF